MQASCSPSTPNTPEGKEQGRGREEGDKEQMLPGEDEDTVTVGTHGGALQSAAFIPLLALA